MSYDIAILPGDGIGPEVVAECVRVLERVAELSGGEVGSRARDVRRRRRHLAADG